MRRGLLSLFALLLIWCATPAGAQTNHVSAETRAETVRVIWETVRDRYFDPEFGGLDWDAVRREMEPKAVQAPSDEAFYDTLQQMVERLGQSHFQVLPPFWVATKHLTRKGPGDAGLAILPAGDRVLVWRMTEPAQASGGLRPGCEILEADGSKLADLRGELAREQADTHEVEQLFLEAARNLFRGRPGGSVTVRYQCGADAPAEAALPLRRSAEQSEEMGHMPSMPTEFESRRLAGNVVYIRFNLFVMTVLPRIRQAIQQAAADGAAGIVFDVRGNPGGIGAMANGITGHLVKEQANLGVMKMRGAALKFLAFPQDGVFTGPVAVLIDRNSASTSEIFAAGLQEMGRAVVVGERSMGAALPSFVTELPAGALLQFAIADFVTPKGFRIEGKGVTPDVPVQLSAESLLNGRDVQLEAALRSIGAQPASSGIVIDGQ